MLKKIVPLFLISLFFISQPLSFADTPRQYSYDSQRSTLSFTLKQLGVKVSAGEFKSFSGSFQFHPERVEDSTVDLSIQTASLKADNRMNDSLLRSKNFFWPSRFPEITFRSKSIENIQGREFDVRGDLTIRGVTRPAIFKTKLITPADQISKDKPLSFETYTFIKRKDYKLGTGNVFDPMIGITNETLKIVLRVEGFPQLQSAAEAA